MEPRKSAAPDAFLQVLNERKKGSYIPGDSNNSYVPRMSSTQKILSFDPRLSSGDKNAYRLSKNDSKSRKALLMEQFSTSIMETSLEADMHPKAPKTFPMITKDIFGTLLEEIIEKQVKEEVQEIYQEELLERCIKEIGRAFVLKEVLKRTIAEEVYKSVYKETVGILVNTILNLRNDYARNTTDKMLQREIVAGITKELVLYRTWHIVEENASRAVLREIIQERNARINSKVAEEIYKKLIAKKVWEVTKYSVHTTYFSHLVYKGLLSRLVKRLVQINTFAAQYNGVLFGRVLSGIAEEYTARFIEKEYVKAVIKQEIWEACLERQQVEMIGKFYTSQCFVKSLCSLVGNEVIEGKVADQCKEITCKVKEAKIAGVNFADSIFTQILHRVNTKIISMCCAHKKCNSEIALVIFNDMMERTSTKVCSFIVSAWELSGKIVEEITNSQAGEVIRQVNAGVKVELKENNAIVASMLLQDMMQDLIKKVSEWGVNREKDGLVLPAISTKLVNNDLKFLAKSIVKESLLTNEIAVSIYDEILVDDVKKLVNYTETMCMDSNGVCYGLIQDLTYKCFKGKVNELNLAYTMTEDLLEEQIKGYCENYMKRLKVAQEILETDLIDKEGVGIVHSMYKTHILYTETTSATASQIMHDVLSQTTDQLVGYYAGKVLEEVKLAAQIYEEFILSFTRTIAARGLDFSKTQQAIIEEYIDNNYLSVQTITKSIASAMLMNEYSKQKIASEVLAKCILPSTVSTYLFESCINHAALSTKITKEIADEILISGVRANIKSRVKNWALSSKVATLVLSNGLNRAMKKRIRRGTSGCYLQQKAALNVIESFTKALLLKIAISCKDSLAMSKVIATNITQEATTVINADCVKYWFGSHSLASLILEDLLKNVITIQVNTHFYKKVTADQCFASLFIDGEKATLRKSLKYIATNQCTKRKLISALLSQYIESAVKDYVVSICGTYKENTAIIKDSVVEEMCDRVSARYITQAFMLYKSSLSVAADITQSLSMQAVNASYNVCESIEDMAKNYLAEGKHSIIGRLVHVVALNEYLNLICASAVLDQFFETAVQDVASSCKNYVEDADYAAEKVQDNVLSKCVLKVANYQKDLCEISTLIISELLQSLIKELISLSLKNHQYKEIITNEYLSTICTRETTKYTSSIMTNQYLKAKIATETLKTLIETRIAEFAYREQAGLEIAKQIRSEVVTYYSIQVISEQLHTYKLASSILSDIFFKHTEQIIELSLNCCSCTRIAAKEALDGLVSSAVMNTVAEFKEACTDKKKAVIEIAEQFASHITTQVVQEYAYQKISYWVELSKDSFKTLVELLQKMVEKTVSLQLEFMTHTNILAEERLRGSFIGGRKALTGSLTRGIIMNEYTEQKTSLEVLEDMTNCIVSDSISALHSVCTSYKEIVKELATNYISAACTQQIASYACHHIANCKISSLILSDMTQDLLKEAVTTEYGLCLTYRNTVSSIIVESLVESTIVNALSDFVDSTNAAIEAAKEVTAETVSYGVSRIAKESMDSYEAASMVFSDMVNNLAKQTAIFTMDSFYDTKALAELHLKSLVSSALPHSITALCSACISFTNTTSSISKEILEDKFIIVDHLMRSVISNEYSAEHVAFAFYDTILTSLITKRTCSNLLSTAISTEHISEQIVTGVSNKELASIAKSMHTLESYKVEITASIFSSLLNNVLAHFIVPKCVQQVNTTINVANVVFDVLVDLHVTRLAKTGLHFKKQASMVAQNVCDKMCLKGLALMIPKAKENCVIHVNIVHSLYTKLLFDEVKELVGEALTFQKELTKSLVASKCLNTILDNTIKSILSRKTCLSVQVAHLVFNNLQRKVLSRYCNTALLKAKVAAKTAETFMKKTISSYIESATKKAGTVVIATRSVVDRFITRQIAVLSNKVIFNGVIAASLSRLIIQKVLSQRIRKTCNKLLEEELFEDLDCTEQDDSPRMDMKMRGKSFHPFLGKIKAKPVLPKLHIPSEMRSLDEVNQELLKVLNLIEREKIPSAEAESAALYVELKAVVVNALKTNWNVSGLERLELEAEKILQAADCNNIQSDITNCCEGVLELISEKIKTMEQKEETPYEDGEIEDPEFVKYTFTRTIITLIQETSVNEGNRGDRGGSG
eukprot:TRINITY_DN87989_c1_g1_i1.p1 TRINITY_DN87989_c1_g1~~TRINITY_DN87989_c1_g1_i1.p1  ORF type:complete len:2171 (+),score=177.13 TRINITY_DN87989_c1_g1_i1:106-6513(+)